MVARQPPRRQSGVHHLAIGDIVVTAVNDGVHQVSLDDLVTTDRPICERSQLAEFRAAPPWLTINCFVIQTKDRTLLVDSGFAGKTEHVGRLRENLTAIDVEPSDIDAILMTHMHPDHEAGLTDADGNPVFKTAELVVHENEIAFWRDDGAMGRASAEGRGDFLLARTALNAYADRIRTAKADDVAPGVRSFPTPGHTPGHMAWLVESGGDALLIWGDVVHFVPEASVAFDIDASAAASARKKLLAFAAGEELRVAGIHLDFPTFGHVAP
jgi:glyoxylase-like metal-dependent hydrolase (beta-lactamase superfamily II)